MHSQVCLNFRACHFVLFVKRPHLLYSQLHILFSKKNENLCWPSPCSIDHTYLIDLLGALCLGSIFSPIFVASVRSCGTDAGGSEPERPSRVISLTTGRIPEPLNPGLHTVRTTAPWDSSRGALTAPVFSLDPCHEQSGAAHNDPPPLPRLNWDHKYSWERMPVCSCFLRCLWLSDSLTLSSQPGPGSIHTLTPCTHADRHQNHLLSPAQTHFEVRMCRQARDVH